MTMFYFSCLLSEQETPKLYEYEVVTENQSTERHSGENPYSSSKCDRRYARSDRLRDHLIVKLTADLEQLPEFGCDVTADCKNPFLTRVSPISP